MIIPRKISPQAEHRSREMERVNSSASLAEQFPILKSLTVLLAYFATDGTTQNGHVKYTVNVQHAKSVFCFVCRDTECVGGNFDLSRALADAVTTRRTMAEGQMSCLGWRSKAKQSKVPCHNLLRYTLKLEYV